MQLRSDVSKVFAVAVLGLALAAPSAAQCDRLWAADHELWIDDGTQPRLVASDVQGVLHPRWSPAGERITYAHEFRFEGSVRTHVVVVGDDGRTLRSLALPADSEVNALLQLGWRDEHHVFIEGHVNPSTSKYLEWDIDSGRLVDEKAGSWFAVSPDGRFIAQRAHVPHGAPPPYDGAMLMINDKLVYPPADDRGDHRFVSGLSWSADSRQLALLEEDQSATDLVVTDSAGTQITRTPLGEIGAPRELSWSSANSIFIRTNSDTWRFDLSSRKLDKVRERSIAPQSVAPPPHRLRGTGARLEDARCMR